MRFFSSTETVVEQAINQKKPVVVDTTILFDFLKTGFSSNALKSEELEALANVLPQFSQIIITPHVLTEVSTLAHRRMKGRSEFFLEKAKPFLLTLKEENIEKNKILNHKKFQSFGACDVSVLICSGLAEKCLITNDAIMRGYGKSAGLAVISMGDLLAHYLNYYRQ